MKRKLLLGLIGALGLVGTATTAVAHEHDRDFRRPSIMERRKHEERERERFNRHFDRDRFDHDGRIDWYRY